MKKKRVWMVVGIVLVLAAVGLVLTRATAPATSAQGINTQLGRVTQATLSRTVDSSGSVAPASEVTLSFGTAGTVSKVNVRPSDRVKQGEVLAELDTSDIALQVAQQEQAYLIQQANYSMTLQPDPAEVAAAEISLANATAAYHLAQQKYAVNSTDQVAISCNNVDSAKRTYDDAVTAYNNYLSNWRVQVTGSAEISPQKAQLDRAQAAYNQAVINCKLAKDNITDSNVKSALAQLEQAKVTLDNLQHPSERTVLAAQVQLDQARLALDQARQQLIDAQIMAPFDGVVTQITAQVGGSGGANPAVMLADTNQYHVDVLIDETEVGQVQVGQKAEITFDALPQGSVTGVVARIDPAGTINQGVVYYLTRVNLDPTAEPLLLDMTANIRIIIDTHENVLAVPGGAIRSDPQGGYYVNVVDANGEAQRVDVTAGYTDGDLTEVSGNLQRGQSVYLSEPPAQAQQGLGLFGMRAGGR
ncbi:Macrolide export protein MacA [Thermoflexales bacterium]|nr:Macrolide export protein MacA [Thermoflexales bacterium]